MCQKLNYLSSSVSFHPVWDEQYSIALFPHLKHPSGMSESWSHSSSSIHSQPPASEKDLTHSSQLSEAGFGVGFGTKDFENKVMKIWK